MAMTLNALVVDDSGVMRKMIIEGLKNSKLAEFEFVEAEDGADALAKFDPAKIDIAFVDWNMPNMTGVDFVRKVRAIGDTEHIPMIMVTSEKTMGKMQEALDEAGADVFISKPFTAEELAFKLRKPIERVQVFKMRQARQRMARR